MVRKNINILHSRFRQIWDQIPVFCGFCQLHSWQPGIKNPYRGLVLWQVPETLDITVTLFKVWSNNSVVTNAEQLLYSVKSSNSLSLGTYCRGIWRQGMDFCRWKCESTNIFLVISCDLKNEMWINNLNHFFKIILWILWKIILFLT